MKLMVVESPNKVKKIASILGDGWQVEASAGHVRDLPKRELGIEGEGYELQYEFIPPSPIPGSPGRFFPGGEARVGRIAQKARQADTVYLATDPDREGEAIAWHLKDALDLQDGDYERVTFTEITAEGVHKAVASPRRIDMQLVHAQEARRALDRIVGYMVSPLLSDQLGMSVSAGRVQSPAVRLVVDREREIKAFRETNHFGARVSFDAGAWSAEWNTRPFLDADQKYLLDEALAARAAACRDFKVTASETTTQAEAPPPPFSTALLLQAASVTLKFDPEVTAKLAQKLFEQGVITYIRTDSVNFSEQAIGELRTYAQGKGWALPASPRRFKAKGDAQEAHEAIRPTHVEATEAGESADERALYRLIWLRSMASQLADARYSVNTVDLQAQAAGQTFDFRAKGRVMIDTGWRVLTATDAAEDLDAESEEDDAPAGGKVPKLDAGTSKRADSGQLLKKRTKPPTRYTKASLIKKLESSGIGRPATYPAIMGNVMAKGYLAETKRFLSPTKVGCELVDTLVKGQFGFIELPFTKELEEDLDRIAEGQRSYVAVVGEAYSRLQREMTGVATSGALAPRHPCPNCGKPLRRASKEGRTYWYCTAYKDGCNTFMDDADGEPVARKEYACPECSAALRRYQRKDAAGKPLKAFGWFCTNDGCKNFMDDDNGKPVAKTVHHCEKCEGELRRYQKKDKESGKPVNAFGWFCTTEGCKSYYDDAAGQPVKNQSCPKCKSELRRYQKKDKESGRPLKTFGWFCTNRECKTFLDDRAGRPVKAAQKGKKG